MWLTREATKLYCVRLKIGLKWISAVTVQCQSLAHSTINLCRKHHAMVSSSSSSSNQSNTNGKCVHCYAEIASFSNVNLIYSQRRFNTHVPCNSKSISFFLSIHPSLIFCYVTMCWYFMLLRKIRRVKIRAKKKKENRNRILCQLWSQTFAQYFKFIYWCNWMALIERKKFEKLLMLNWKTKHTHKHMHYQRYSYAHTHVACTRCYNYRV